jgi:putative spermidine/putrescine transport system substrate-binding protein
MTIIRTGWPLRLAGALGCCALLSGTASGAETITLASFGGAYGESQKKAYATPFQDLTGTHVSLTEYNGGLGEIRAQVESGAVAWDVVDVEMQDAVRGCDDGLFEKLNDVQLPAAANGTPAAEDFLPGTLTDCGVGSIVWSTILAVRDDKFPSGKPATVQDFFDLEKFPGKRGAMKKPQTLLEWALIADGVDKAEVYKVLATEEGVARAFSKLDTIKKDVVWWETHAQAPQLLADGEVAMTMAANGRIFDAIHNDKQPFSIVWDHQIWNLDLWAIPKGSKNAAEAKAFIAFAAKPEQLAAQTKYISYGPVRRSAAAMVDAAIASQLPTAEANFKTALQNDFQFWADHGDELSERFNVWLNQ